MLMDVSVLHIPLQLQTYRREEEKDRWFVKLVQPLSACTEKTHAYQTHGYTWKLSCKLQEGREIMGCTLEHHASLLVAKKKK